MKNKLRAVVWGGFVTGSLIAYYGVFQEPETTLIAPNIESLPEQRTADEALKSSSVSQNKDSLEVDAWRISKTITIASVGSDQEQLDDSQLLMVEGKNDEQVSPPSAPRPKSQDLAIEDEKSPTSVWSAGASLTFGFKPTYYAAESKGQYSVFSLRVVRRVGKVAVAFSQPWLLVPEAKGWTTQDPSIAVSLPGVLTLPGKVSVGVKASAKPGVSEASREVDLHGTGSVVVSATKSSALFTVGLAARYTQKFYRYKFDLAGSSNTKEINSGSGFVAIALPGDLALTGSLALTKSTPFMGASRFSYSNGLDLSGTIGDGLSWSIGTSNADSQLSPAGEDNNIFTVYKRNQTEMYVSFGYSI